MKAIKVNKAIKAVTFIKATTVITVAKAMNTVECHGFPSFGCSRITLRIMLRLGDLACERFKGIQLVARVII